MADITISDLELAPALTDDMVLPVENTTDTYAATLAMLRRLINKTFVEVENADFNALTDDGFYQCTGTPTNSPVAGAINWTLQVSAENGVVVQRAFSLDDNFANIYIRNGVTWTGWLEVGAGALANKANINLDNLSATGEAKIAGSVPTGSILPYGGSTAPTGWFLCNGGAISRTTYADLFSVIGTSYGAGDGSTTFNLPNLINVKLLKGASVPVKGTGLSLGLTNGTQYGAMAMTSDYRMFKGYTDKYGSNVGSIPGGTSANEMPVQRTVGVTTDSRYSGIIADISSGVNANFIIKY